MNDETSIHEMIEARAAAKVPVKDRTFCAFLRECTDLTCSVTIGILKEHGPWSDEDDLLLAAIERGDDTEARRLVLSLGLLDHDVLVEADEWVAGEIV